MWRKLGLTLVLVAGATTTAHADGGLDMSVGGIESALHQSAAVTGKGDRAPRTASEALQLQVGDALALTQPSLRATLPGSVDRRYLAPHQSAPREQTGPERRAIAARWLDLDGTRPMLDYPVTDRLSLGLRYSYLRGEDLIFKVAKTGSLNDTYQSHRVLLRAQWEF
jgi:hypothetical protein